MWLLDIGNTHTHLGLWRSGRVVARGEFPTSLWSEPTVVARLRRRMGTAPGAVAICSVVPQALKLGLAAFAAAGVSEPYVLTHRSVRGIGIEYPKPATIGPDRLANAAGVHHRYGGPCIVVDFGTAVTFDVVNERGNYAGGIIAPGLAAMTDYLHEKTALLPRIEVRRTAGFLGKNTRQAMCIGAYHGYRGLIKELMRGLQAEFGWDTVPMVATGGYARLMAAQLPGRWTVAPLLTLEGLARSCQIYRAD